MWVLVKQLKTNTNECVNHVKAHCNVELNRVSQKDVKLGEESTLIRLSHSHNEGIEQTCCAVVACGMK